ncbi:MAG: hypothetical protein E7582_01395 [Ruminococcaceae bacterium]|nr:hypothetical protein [Oscillospiraceae bacterium]
MKKRDVPERSCAYCEKAHILIDNESALCRHKGPVSLDFRCRRFVFDPLKVNLEPRKLKKNTKIETLWSEE